MRLKCCLGLEKSVELWIVCKFAFDYLVIGSVIINYLVIVFLIGYLDFLRLASSLSLLPILICFLTFGGDLYLIVRLGSITFY